MLLLVLSTPSGLVAISSSQSGKAAAGRQAGCAGTSRSAARAAAPRKPSSIGATDGSRGREPSRRPAGFAFLSPLARSAGEHTMPRQPHQRRRSLRLHAAGRTAQLRSTRHCLLPGTFRCTGTFQPYADRVASPALFSFFFS